MSASAPATVEAKGLSTVVNTIAAPTEAFETLRVAPTWGWALALTVILMLIGTFLQGPALRHAGTATMQQAIATSSLFANMKPADKARAVENAGKTSAFTYITPVIIIFIVVLLNTIFMLIGNVVGHGQADFKRLWAGSMNIAVPTLGIGAIVLGIIVMIRGADAFNSQAEIMRAQPGLGMLAGNASAAMGAFLSAITVFSLWGFYLNATMLRTTAKTSAGVAYAFAAIVLLLGAAFAAMMVGVLHGMGLA